MHIVPLQVCGYLWMGWAFIWVVSAQFALKTKWNETFQRLQHTVPTLIGIMSIFFGPEIDVLNWGQVYDSEWIMWLGVPVTIAGHAFSLWARIHLGKYWSGTVALKHNHKLIRTGPYRLVRHPIYTGLLSAALGSAVAAGTKEAFFGVVVLIVGYAIKWKREEKLMLDEFGAYYAYYRWQTKAIIPYIF